jgi:uncharacterized delta-60 repeat protein
MIYERFAVGARVIALVCLVLCASGGGGEHSGGGGATTPPPPPPPPPVIVTGIGATGGTVTEASGAKVVVPAGALAAQTNIAVTQSSNGAPALPAGVTNFGPIYAFTPHGTTFAAPVTITVPFDPTKVPAGTTPVLYKTNAAQSEWAEVAGATVSGASMSGAVTSFSFLFVGPIQPPALEKGAPKRDWIVIEFRRNRSVVEPLTDIDNQNGGLLEKDYDFGPKLLLDPGVPLPEILPREFRATGHIFSSPGGGSYSVSNEAPVSRGDLDVAGSVMELNQSQSYLKNAATAKLSLVVTQARLEAFDNAEANPGPCARPGPRCFDQKYGQIVYQVTAITKPSAAHPTVRKLFVGEGAMKLAGWRGHWTSNLDGGPVTPIWTDKNVQTDLDVEAAGGRHARVSLIKALTVPIDISSVDVNEEFTLLVHVNNYVFDGRPAPEANYLGAFMRDPTLIDGDMHLVIEGLVPTDSPTEPPVDDPNLPAECRAQPAAGALQFAFPSYSVPEGVGPDGIDLLVTRVGGSAGEVTATVNTSNGTASAPSDYQSVSSTVTFKDGDIAPRFINVPLVYSTDAEGDKSFTVTLSAPTGCATLGQTTSVVTILDDTRPVPAARIFSLGGTVTGLAGSGLMLRTDAFDQVQPSGNGAFTFPVLQSDGTVYSISVAAQPANPVQVCTVANGTGTIAGASVNNILVNCVTPPPPSGLDLTFGSQGRAFSTIGSARVLAQQRDGKLLALGGLVLTRYNTDGTPDTAFGSGGKVDIVTNGSQTDKMTAMLVQPDGKIVVVGYTSPPTVPNENFITLRYNADGTEDTSFGLSGRIVTDFEGHFDRATAVLLQRDDKIVVVGQAQIEKLVDLGPIHALVTDQDFAAVRYLPDGSTDQAFGTNGKATLDAGGLDYVNAAALQFDGGIVVVGRVTVADGTGNPDMAVVRFLANGGGDPGFGAVRIDYASGVVPGTFNGGDTDEALDVAIQSNGKILVAGYALTGTSHIRVAALVRLTTTGALERNIGPSISPTIDRVNGITLQRDGGIVIAGTGDGDFGLERFTADGEVDTTFGSRGLMTVDFFGAVDEAFDVLIQADDKIVAGGVARNGTSGGVGLVRVLP